MDDLGLTRDRRQQLANTVVAIKHEWEKGHEWGCYVFFREITDTYEQIWVNLQLKDDAGIRAAIKRFQLAERIYDAQHQRDDPEQVS
jgi:hypothetical protein